MTDAYTEEIKALRARAVSEHWANVPWALDMALEAYQRRKAR